MSGLIYHNDKRRILPAIERSDTFKSTKSFESINDTSEMVIDYKDDSAKIRLKKWKKDKRLGVAGEILSLALVRNESEIVHELKEYILSQNNNNAIIGETNYERRQSLSDQLRIAHNKRKLSLEPKDAVTWTEQAISYISLGHREKALQCINIATDLEKDMAYVLRNASRIHSICGDNNRAIYLLKRSQYYKYDPQILSAEIAFSELVERKTRGIDYGRRIIENSHFTPHEMSELTSAIATVEYFNGDHKKSEELFDKSLIDPTDNSFAQSLWYKQSPIEDKRLDYYAQSNEIQAHRYSKEGDFTKSLKYSKDWQTDEPFSRRPYQLSSHLVGGIFDNNLKAAEISLEAYNKQKQVKSRLDQKEDFGLRNDIAYYLLKAGRTREAMKYLQPILKLRPERRTRERYEYFCLATIGLFLYKVGENELGKQFYKKAIKYFFSKREMYNARVAFINYYNEEIFVLDNEEKRLKLRKEFEGMVPDNIEHDLNHLKKISLKLDASI